MQPETEASLPEGRESLRAEAAAVLRPESRALGAHDALGSLGALDMRGGWSAARRSILHDGPTLALLGGICLFAVANVLLFRYVEIDDAYITFRYADNVAHGHGAVFNVGERVEGTSSLPFALLVAAGLRLGASPIQAARVLSLVADLGLVVLAYATVTALARKFGRLLGLGAAAIVAASTPLAYFTNGGLETLVYAFLVALTVFLLVRRPSAPRGIGWAVAGGFAAIMRPEGPFFVAALLVVAVVPVALETRSVGMTLKYALRATLAVLAILGPMLLFRRIYYHAWVPNTVLAKAGSSHRFHGKSLFGVIHALSTGEGAGTVAEYFGHLGVEPLVALAGLLSKRTRFATLVMLTVVAGCVATTLWNDGDWMGYERLLTAAMAPMAVAIALGVSALLFERPLAGSVARLGTPVLAVLTFAAAAGGSFYDRSGQGPPNPKLAPLYMNAMARELRATLRDDDVLATDMAGTIPYYWGIRTIDTFGLCDPVIAREGKPWPRMGKTDFDYVIGRKPTFYVFNFPAQLNDLFHRPAFASQLGDYLALVTPEYQAYDRNDRKLFVVRRDRPGLGDLAAALHAKLVDARDELQRITAK